MPIGINPTHRADPAPRRALKYHQLIVLALTAWASLLLAITGISFAVTSGIRLAINLVPLT